MGEASIGAPGLGALGWALGIGLATVVAASRLRASRQREALNRALHELRRPLQSLVLGSGVGGDAGSHAIRVALAAVADLDRALNGGRRRFEPRPLACRAVVESAVERWRGIAASSNRSLILGWHAGSAVVLADPVRLSQALDNLIHNAIRHGGLRVRVNARAFAGGVRISVADSGAVSPARDGRQDPRHGHGLPVVAAVAAEHGGRFLVRRSSIGTVAILELPFAPLARPASAVGRVEGPAGRLPRPRDRIRVRGVRLRGSGGDPGRRLSRRHPERARPASSRGRRPRRGARGDPARARGCEAAARSAPDPVAIRAHRDPDGARAGGRARARRA
ncbi:MAG: sensor histidine kinase, partial [Solirubrobacterales bacterium]